MRNLLNKNLVSFLAFSLLIGSMLTACSSDKDDDNSRDIVFAAKAGNKTYCYSYSTGATVPDSPYVTTAIAGSSIDSNYGIYNGAALSITYYLQGEGEYTITNNDEFFAAAPAKKMKIDLTVGTGNPGLNTCLYSIISGKATVKVIEGKYHITIKEAVTGTSTLTLGKEKFAESVSLVTYDAYSKD